MQSSVSDSPALAAHGQVMAESHTILTRRPLDVRSALREGISRLRDANVPSHTLAAELLLMHALGRDRAWIYSHAEFTVSLSDGDRYLALIARRAAGEPTQYLTGKQEFWGLEFEVNPSVLIPRPETEHVIEVALQRLREREVVARYSGETRRADIRIADVGTGSGCIAIALAKELPAAEIFATDISQAALEVAKRNASRHGAADRIRFVQTNLLDAFQDARSTGYEPVRFDLVVSNPPYLAREGAASLPREVREHEPATSLFGGPKGTESYAPLIEQARELLMPGGILVLELGYDSAPRVQSILEGSAAWARIETTNDLASIPRVIAAEKT